MIALLIAATAGMALSLLAMPLAIKSLRQHGIGQFIREEVEGHAHKQGTPTMGGAVFVLAALLAYALAHVRLWTATEGFTFDIESFGAGGLLAMLGLLGMAVIGFFDDYIKTTRRRSRGLSKRAKFAGQLAISAVFAIGAEYAGVSAQLSLTRPLGVDLGIFFVVLVLLMFTAGANGANFADGMDGLASGSAALMFGAYTIITFWQFRNPGTYPASTDPRELAITSAAMLGALLGFLWWNAPPARIFMGDVGSNAIGGLLAALALLSNTQLLLILLAGLFVAEGVSVVIQIIGFHLFGRRVFRMAPFHHHFELLGWPETTIVIRFWILAGIGVALALGLFYADFIRAGGLFG